MTTFHELLTDFRESLDGDYVVALEADRFVKKLKRSHPEILHEWMETQTVHYVQTAIRHDEMQQRSRTLRRVQARAFNQALTEGDEIKLRLFAVRFTIDDKRTRRTLGEMTGSDCGHAADLREAALKTELLIQAFLRVLQQKARNKKISDVLSEAQCESALRSLAIDDDAFARVMAVLMEGRQLAAA